jgi:hypothetical protein
VTVGLCDVWEVHKERGKVEKMTEAGRSDDIKGCRKIELSKPLKIARSFSYFIESICF